MQIDCPGCGGHLDILLTDRFVTCEYCDNTLHVELGTDLIKTTFQSNVSLERIPGLLTRELRNRDLRDEAKILKTEIIIFPFWKFESPDRTVLKPAASTLQRVLRDYTLEDGTLAFFTPPDNETAIVVEPDVYLDTALSSVEGEFTRKAIRPSQLYVPFYRIRYLYGQHTYMGFITGHTGRVLFETLPPGPAADSNVPLAVTSFMIFLGYALLSFATVFFTGRFSLSFLLCLGLSFLLFKFLTKQIIQ